MQSFELGNKGISLQSAVSRANSLQSHHTNNVSHSKKRRTKFLLDDYWRYYLLINVVKKIKEYQNQRIINIQLNPGTAAGHQEGTSPIIQQQFNNQKHNNPFLNDKQVCIIAVLTFLIFGTILSFHFYNDFIGQCKVLNLATKEFLYRVLFLEPIVFKVITPIMYLIQRKDAQSFFWMTIEDIICW